MCLYKIFDIDIDGADKHEEGHKDDIIFIEYKKLYNNNFIFYFFYYE